MQHERKALSGRQRLEDDEQCEPNGVGEHRFLLQRRSRGVDELEADGLLAANGSRAQEVQADPRNDRGHPSVDVLDVGRTRSAHAQPGVLDGIVGLRERAEHPVRDGAQMASLLLEAIREPQLFVCHAFRCPRGLVSRG